MPLTVRVTNLRLVASKTGLPGVAGIAFVTATANTVVAFWAIRLGRIWPLAFLRRSYFPKSLSGQVTNVTILTYAMDADVYLRQPGTTLTSIWVFHPEITKLQPSLP